MGDFSSWQPSELRLNRKWLIALIVLGAASLIALFMLGDRRQTMDLIRRADWRLLLLALLIHYSGFAMRGLRWKVLLGTLGHPRPYLYCTGLLISGWFVSAIIPARAGDILRVGLLRVPLGSQSQFKPDPEPVPTIQPQPQPEHVEGEHVEGEGRLRHAQATGSEWLRPVPVADGISSIVLERVLDMVAILLLGASFGFWVLRGQLPSWVLTLYGTVIVLLGVLGVALLILPRLWGLLGTLWQQPIWQKLVAFGAEMTQKLALLLRSPGTALVVTGLSVYIWLCDALLLWFVMMSLGETIAFGPAAFVALTVDIIAAVPLTPGGIGQIEAAYATLLGLMALPVVKLPTITAIILLTRLISYWSFLLFSGFVTLLVFWSARNRAAN